MALAAFLKHHCKLRLYCGWDPIHEAVNTVNRSLRLAGLWPTVIDLVLAWKLPWGPWLSLGFWRKLQQAAKTATEVAASAKGLLQWLLAEVEEELQNVGGMKALATVWEKKGTKHRP
jgi:hypothetical protein